MDSAQWTDAQALAYIASYSDLMAAFGGDAQAGRNHYAIVGRMEGRSIAFDALSYIASYDDLRRAFEVDAAAGAMHFISTGRAEGRSITFYALSYIASYTDLTSAFGANSQAGAIHFIQAGRAEGRSITFDAVSYIASYADLVKAFGTDAEAGARHYIQAGRLEGRTITFDGLAYIASYTDLIRAFGADATAGARHYILAGQNEGRTTTFDAVAYLLSEPDLAAANLGAAGALRHWISAGFAEGRAGGASFGHEQLSHDLALGTITNAAIDLAGDKDWFKIDLTAGSKIEFDLDLRGGQGLVSLYDSFGHVIQPAARDGHSFVFDLANSGSYFVVTSASDPALTSSYSLLAHDYFSHVVGTAEDDTLVGTSSADRIEGLSGGDYLDGGAGNDVLEGGLGHDHLDGGLGDDVLYGNTAINSGADGADDLMDTRGGNDQLFGQDGNDSLYIGRSGSMQANSVLLDGGAGNDTIVFVSSQRASDTVTVRGGMGNDTINIGSASTVRIDAGDGNDQVRVSTNSRDQAITLGTGVDVLTVGNQTDNFGQLSPIRVTDFQVGTDSLQMKDYLASILFGWDQSRNPFFDYLKLTQSGTDTILQIDRDSYGSGYGYQNLVVFENKNAGDFSAHDLGYAPSLAYGSMEHTDTSSIFASSADASYGSSIIHGIPELAASVDFII